MTDYNKVALLTLRGDRLLLCRKDRLASNLILPGGCIEPGESAMECLARELREELGGAAASNLRFVGEYSDIAASENPGEVKTLHIRLYQGELQGVPAPSSEIVELVWFGPDSDFSQLTPIMIHHILPDLLRRKILPWSIDRLH
ncbi:MAG: NUDIX domain-containing protein [Candidatus Omnitrophota bacterium]